MKQSESGELRPGSRLIAAAARQASAAEKARITRTEAMKLSKLEQAAVELEKQQEASAIKAMEAKFTIPNQMGTCQFSLRRLSIRPDAIGPSRDDVGWRPYSLERGKRTATTVTGRANAAGICTLSRRLIARERARALGKKPMDLRAWTLELEARRWTEERARRK